MSRQTLLSACRFPLLMVIDSHLILFVACGWLTLVCCFGWIWFEWVESNRIDSTRKRHSWAFDSALTTTQHIVSIIQTLYATMNAPDTSCTSSPLHDAIALIADVKGEDPPDHGSRYARALFAEAFDHTNEDLDRALCLYDFGCQYADRKKISNDANDFDSNPTSFKNLMTLRDRGYVTDAFRQQAKHLFNTDDPHGYVLLSQEAEELLVIPLLRVIQSFQVSWAFGLTMTDLKDALNVALDVEEDDESDEDDEPVQLDLRDVVRATEVDPQGFSSLVAFLKALRK